MALEELEPDRDALLESYAGLMPDSQDYRCMLREDDGRERRMNIGKVITGHSMSLDSFIAGPKDGVDNLD